MGGETPINTSNFNSFSLLTVLYSEQALFSEFNPV